MFFLMRQTLSVLLLLLALTSSAFARENVPDPAITPGEVATTDIVLVCQHGYSATVRKTTQDMKRDTYNAYRVRGSRKHWKIDHLVPLSMGGADSMKNIWPSDFKAGKYNAAAKDRLELKIRDLVCNGTLSVEEGQALFMDDWRDAYDEYCPTRASCLSFKERLDRAKR